MLKLFMACVDAEPLGNSCSPYGAASPFPVLLIYFLVGPFVLEDILTVIVMDSSSSLLMQS